MSSRRNPPKRMATRKPPTPHVIVKPRPVVIYEDQIKVEYRTVGGYLSKAYVSESLLIGTNKHTDEDVEVVWDDIHNEWAEVPF